jgi:hypothetical protein
MPDVRALTGGLHTFAEPHAIRDEEATACLNFSFHKPGTMQTRGGYLRGNATTESGSILGVHELAKEDGTLIRLMKTGTTCKLFSVGGADAITAGSTMISGMTASFKPTFVDFQDKVAIFDKTKNYFTNGTTSSELGRDAPTGASVAAVSGGGMPDGAYLYKFTFLSTSLGIESTQSAQITATTSGSNNQITVTLPSGITDEIDTTWTHVRVYRSNAAGTVLFHHSDVTGTFTDNTSTVSASVPLPTDSAYIKLPGARAGASYLGRLWAVIEAEPTNVYHSDVGFADRWAAAQSLRVGEQDGDPILGFLVASDRLFAFKRNATFILVGDSTASFSWKNLNGAMGTAAGRALVNYKGDAYVYQDLQPPYVFRGSGVVQIGERVQDLVQGFKQSVAEDSFVAGFEPQTESIWFAVRQAGSSENDRVLVYFTRTRVWTLYDLEATCMGIVTNNSGEKRLLFGDSSGSLNWAENGVSDGSPGGTLTGAVQSGSSTTEVVTSGTLITAADGLDGFNCTIIYANGTIETQTITSTTATHITLSSALVAGAPALNDTWFVGAVDAQWTGKMGDGGDGFNHKAISTWSVALRANTTAQPLRYRLNYDKTSATTTGTFATVAVTNVNVLELDATGGSGGVHALRAQPEFRHVANDSPLVLQGVKIDERVTGQRRGR